ncbi:hypothetical protein CEXT_717771 [Caerostris extrusa]|uniref:Uncharacterized protein n=1 Tax=Caerostris extrusa TaxID=172846 RepID=A0AAV4RY32_CAEEX|nr:hypothetical protein CEXT_717771 [Caerostris extrusa]
MYNGRNLGTLAPDVCAYVCHQKGRKSDEGLQTIIDALKGNWKSNTNPHSAIEFRAFPENRALWESGEMFVICENQHLYE